MPLVQITMLQGRTAEQKRKLAKRITDAIVEDAGARRECRRCGPSRSVQRKYATGGEVMIDKVK
jgi:4-oxalocrotonate tautomerase family enzyme